MEEHLTFQASAALTLLCSTAASQHRELCEGGNMTWESELLPLGCCWSLSICPQQIVIALMLLFFFQNTAEGSLDFTEDIKTRTG